MYIDAYKDAKANQIHTVNRIDGQRLYKSYPIDWSFYVEDPKGEHKSWFDTKLKIIEPKTSIEHKSLLSYHRNKRIFEGDTNHIFRCFEQEYPDTKAMPAMHVAWFDIETDFHKERGWSKPEHAENEITSIATYLQWSKTMICLAVPPKTLTFEEAIDMTKHMPDVVLCRTEEEMLHKFLDLIEDADVLSGWNSSLYDIPYTVHRLQQVIGTVATRKLCLWGKIPKQKTISFGGKDQITYELAGRLHLDYMDLYKQYNFEERSSYSLNAIAFYELGEQKVEYSGTLDELYNNDFVKFLEYNIQDTRLLDRLDEKLQFMSLVNSIAHGNQVTFGAALGTVAQSDQAITVQAHKMGVKVPNKRTDMVFEDRVVGGWVSRPKKGLHKYTGSSDLNSLYPSVIRAFNMSPETLIAQVDITKTNNEVQDWIPLKPTNTFAGWWNDKFHQPEMEDFYNGNPEPTMKVDFESGETFQCSGKDLRQLVFDGSQKWCITPNGTVFSQSKKGVVPALLERWYNERKELQKTMRRLKFIAAANTPKPEWLTLTEEIDAPSVKSDVYYFPLDDFDKLMESGDDATMQSFMKEWGLTIHNGMISPCASWKTQYKYACDFWDKQQLVRKISLNSIYGGLLNSHMRFFDQRIGQSTTLGGRSITRHMTNQTALMLEGKYGWEDSETIIYNDTDSVYFSIWPMIKDEVEAGTMIWNKELAVQMYDQVSDAVSDTFPAFLEKEFNVPLARGQVIKAGREIVASSSLHITKKRYAAMVYDDEGVRRDTDGKPGKLKVVGLDLRRSDTPKHIQDILSELLMGVLTGKTEQEVVAMLSNFKENVLGNREPWEHGVPKSVNNLHTYSEKLMAHDALLLAGKAKGKVTIPGHVRAAMNWNAMLETENDKTSMRIQDGSKIIVVYLKENDKKFTSIAYPVDEARLPDWFKAMPFDVEDMEARVLDKKVNNLLGVLEWDLHAATKQGQMFSDLFSF